MNEDYKLPIANTQCFLTIPLDVIERCETSFDINNINYVSLLRATLAIRSCGGRYKRAFKTLEDIGIPVPIVVYIVKKVCKILNCGNLDTTIPNEETVRAFDQFLIQQNPDTYPSLPLNRNPIINETVPNNIPPQWNNPANVMEFVPGSSYNSPRTGYYNDQQEFQRKNLANNNNYRGNNTYTRSPYSSLSNTPRIPDNNSNIYGEGIDEYHNSYENQHVAPGLIDAMSSNNPIPLHSYNLNLPNPISPIHLQILQLLLPEVDIPALFQYSDNDFINDQSPNRGLNYRTFTPDVSSISQLFWILSICIFLTVCDDRQSIEETLIRIEELSKFVGSGNSELFTMSPVLGVALDVITQRVVYELSDKIAVPSINEDFSDDGVTSESTNRRNSKISNDISDKDSFDTTASNLNINNDDNNIIENIKDVDSYSNTNKLYSIIHTNSIYAHDLYKCISIMLYSVSESCIRIESSILPANTSSTSTGMNSMVNSGFNTPTAYEYDAYHQLNNSSSKSNISSAAISPVYLPQTQTLMNSRTQKLSKQLREALAWSSCKDQLPLQSYQAILRMTSANANNNDNNVTSRSTLDPQLILSLKYKSADQAINNLIYNNSIVKISDLIYNDIDNMHNRLNSLFYHASTIPNLSDFQDSTVELGSISSTPLIISHILNSQSSGNISGRSNYNNNSNNSSSASDIEYVLNIPNLTNKIQSIKSQKILLQNKLNLYHDILRIDTTIENCLKHIKACIKEIRNQMNVYCNDLQNYLLSLFRKSSINNNAMANNTMLGNLSARSNNSYTTGLYNNNPNIRSNSFNDVVLNPQQINMKITKIRIEMENICTLGDKIIATMGNNLRSLRSNSSNYNINPSTSSSFNNLLDLSFNQRIQMNDYEILQKLSMLLQTRRYLIDEISKLNELESNEYKRYLKLIEQILREAQFPNFKLILLSKNSGIRIVNSNMNSNIKYNYYLLVNNNGYYNNRIELSKLYNLYINKDNTNKIQLYLSCILQFSKIHQLCDGDNGTLCYDAWMILGLHVLLHYEIINNLHEHYLINKNNDDESNHIEISNVTNGVDYQFTGGSNFIATGNLSARSGRSTGSQSHGKKTRLEEISILRMLELFFRYMTEEFDILGSVVTLRGKGEAIPKNQWRLDPPVMWRLSIEDPFDHAVENITRPHDLGTTLTRPGQIQVFKAVRRAAYGVNAIVIKDIGETEKYVRMLFHKDDLLSLSRVSGYNGAAVITAPVYHPPSTKLSKVIVTWITELGAHFPPLLLHKPLTRTVSMRSNRLGTRQNSIRQNSPRFNQSNAFDDPSIVHIEGDYDDLSGSDDDDPLTPRVDNSLGEIKKPANVPTIPLGSLKDASFNSSRSTNSLLTPNMLTPNTNYSNYSSLSPNVNSNYLSNKPMDIYSQQQQQQQQQQQLYFNQMKSNPQSQSHNNIYLNENQSQELYQGQRLFNPATSYNNMKSQSNRTNYPPNQRSTNLTNNGPINGYNEFGNSSNDPQFNGNKLNSPRMLYPANNGYDNSSNRLGNNTNSLSNNSSPYKQQVPIAMQQQMLPNYNNNQLSNDPMSSQYVPSDLYYNNINSNVNTAPPGIHNSNINNVSYYNAKSNNAIPSNVDNDYNYRNNLNTNNVNNYMNTNPNTNPNPNIYLNNNINRNQSKLTSANPLDFNNLFNNLSIDNSLTNTTNSNINNDLNYNIGFVNDFNSLSMNQQNLNSDSILDPHREPRINSWLGNNIK